MSLQSKLADTSLGFKDILEAEVMINTKKKERVLMFNEHYFD